VSPQRRTALVSIVAASVLIAVKLSTGVASGSLGLVSEAVHSGTDLVAALLTFFAVGYAGRPADEGHPFGHGKAEHLAALAEAGILSLVSIGVAALAVARLAGWISSEVEPQWWAFAAVGLVIALFEMFRSETVPLLFRTSTPCWNGVERTLFVIATAPSMLFTVAPLSLNAMFESNAPCDVEPLPEIVPFVKLKFVTSVPSMPGAFGVFWIRMLLNHGLRVLVSKIPAPVVFWIVPPEKSPP